jgi:hypothetical protein
MMDNGLTGNIYMGYPDPESGLPFDAWEYYKTTNLDSGIAPFLHLYVEESALDNILDSVLKRAALTDALKEIDIDYAKYEAAINNPSSPDRGAYIDAIRKANVEYFMAEIEKADNEKKLSKPVQFVSTTNASAAVSELVKFMQSKEGQSILNKAGYVGVDKAADYKKSLLAVSYVLEEKGNAIAYFALSNDNLSYEDFVNKSSFNRINRRINNAKRMRHYPAMKIGRLAIDLTQRKKGIGLSSLNLPLTRQVVFLCSKFLLSPL